MKETLESVVVAFILAFVFRAFIVEAFVIPTGSMAPTLYGVHGTLTCQDCGTSYAYGLKENGGRVAEDFRSCPNCGNEDNRPEIEPKVYESGDRILVLKWPFDIGGSRLGPKRWDVVVFKTPSDGTTNYIKRLVGLPNEVLEIIDGDIYTVPVPELERSDPGLLGLLDEQLVLDAEYGRLDAAGGNRSEVNRIGQRLDALGEEITAGLDRWLTIRRKSDTSTGRRAQESLWLPVHNQDYLPHRRRDDSPPPGWVAMGEGSPWDASSHVVAFSGANSDERVLRFRSGPDRGVGGSGPDRGVRDRYAYNSLAQRRGGESFCVGDSRLRFILDARAGTGHIRLSLSKGPDRFVATLHQNGECELERLGATAAGGERYPGTRIDPIVPGRPVPVEFSNVDYRVSLRVRDREVLTADYEPKRPLAELRREDAQIPSVIEVAAARMDLSLQHIVLERDVYYQTVQMHSGGGHWGGRLGWGVGGHPILLRPKEYFVCGDNSPQSADSRLWGEIGPHLLRRGPDYQAGTVPEDQLIGRAFFVYWPSGLKLFPSLPIRLVPNVGEMRWIR